MIADRYSPRLRRFDLSVSNYERASGLLVSSLILVGASCTLLCVLWVTQKVVHQRPPDPGIRAVEFASRGANAVGFERDLDAPGFEELAVITDPQLVASLAAVTDAVSVVASLDNAMDAPSVPSFGQNGLGDHRQAGPNNEGENVIPRWERWEIKWKTDSLSAYARQLDYFNIALGAVGGSRSVDYAFSFGKPRPDTKSGLPAEEARLYMTWKGGTLRAFDSALLQKAGINTRNRLLLQFYPEAVETQLAEIEMANARRLGHSTEEELLKTVFAVQRVGGGLKFVVESQRFRIAGR